MRAVVVEQPGGPEVMRVTDRPEPSPGEGQLVVDVAAAGVNFIDIYQREGRYQLPTPFGLGREGAGTVRAVGAGVEGFAVGDRVAWSQAQGSYAEQVAVPAGEAVLVPDGVELQTAAAVMLQGLTAHYLSHSTYAVGAGDVVVVHAAAGGVGLLLTQLVKRLGGVVVATVSNPEKAELARAAGADRVVGYAEMRAAVDEVTGRAGAAVVYDGVGATTFDDSLAALRRRGMLVLYGASSGAVPALDPIRLMAGSRFLTRPTLADYVADRAELEWRAGDLFRWVRDGELDVRVGGTYSMTDAARAHEDLAGRRTTGKLLLLP